MSNKRKKASKLEKIQSQLKGLGSKVSKKAILVSLAALSLSAGSFKTGEHQGFRSGELGECNLLVGKFMNPQLSPNCSYGKTGELEVVIQVPLIGEIRYNQKTGQKID